MGSKTISMILSYSIILKFIVLPYTLDASFIQVWLCEDSWLFGKCWVAELSRSSKWWHHFIMSHFSLINIIIRKKTFKFRETVKLTVANVHFPKLWFSFESLNFIVGSKYCHLFFLDMTAHSPCSLWRKYLLNLHVWITLICQPFFLVKITFCGETVS